MKFRYIASPFGKLLIAGDREGLKWVSYPEGSRAVTPSPEWVESPRDELLRDVKRQLDDYFAGRRTRFDLPLRPEGTPFQRSVWSKLCTIPYGKTTTYGDIAKRLKRPAAFRAVGAANGQNPVSIIIPCHRLVGKSGHLTGYGGGLSTKKSLLQLEGATP